MDISKLKLKVDREGFLNKNATAKVKDEVRGNWNVRYFMLRGNVLSYYKKKGDNEAKGEMDLTLAKIEDADARVGKPFSIRIAQARQMFTYVIANDSDDKREWVRALRRAAGYQEDELDDEMAALKAKQPKGKQETVASFGCLLKTDDTDHPDRCVLVLLPDASVGFGNEGHISRNYPATNLESVTFSTDCDIRLVDTTGSFDLYSLTMVFKTQQGNAKYVIYMGTVEEASALCQILRTLMKGDSRPLKQIQDQSAVVHSGPAQIGDLSMSGNWRQRFVCLTESTCLVYKSAEGSTPVWAIDLGHTKLGKSGSLAIQVRSGIETAMFKFDSEDHRDLWFKGMKTVAKTQREKLEREASHKDKDRDRDHPVFSAEPDKEEEEAPGPPPHDEMELDLPVASPLEEGENTYVVAWGLNANGQLGTRSKDDALLPTLVKPLEGKGVQWLSAGATHAAAVTDKGHVYIWGQGDEFQLGLGKSNKASTAPYLVTSLLQKGQVAMVSCGRAHTMAITTKGDLYTWGSNSHGQLGLGTPLNEHVLYPQQVAADLQNRQVTYASAGYEHSAAIAGEEVWLWGENKEGALGTANKIGFEVPKRNDFLAEKGPSKQVQCGASITAVLQKDGLLFTFGRNRHGQLGHADTENKHLPTLVQYFKRQNLKVMMVSCGEEHMVAQAQPAKGDGREVYTWGRAVVNGFQEDQVLPAKVAALENTRFVQAGRAHSITINDKLNIFSFGVNKCGELGNGKAGVQALVKVRLSSRSQVVQAVCGDFFSLALCRGKIPSKLVAGDKAEYEKAKADPHAKDFNEFSRLVDDAVNAGGPLTLDSSTDVVAQLLATVNTDPRKVPKRQEKEFQNLGGKALDMLNEMEAHRQLGEMHEGKALHVEALLSGISLQHQHLQQQHQHEQHEQHEQQEQRQQMALLRASVASPTSHQHEPVRSLGPAASSTTSFEEPDRSLGPAGGGGEDGEHKEAGGPKPAPKPLAVMVEDHHEPEHEHHEGGAKEKEEKDESRQHEEAGHEHEEREEEKKKKKELPPGWKKTKDEKTGRYYYYNKKTKEVQWKRPKV